MTFDWTDQQIEVFKFAERATGQNLYIQARAGCAKSTTLVETVKRVGDPETALFVFGKDNAEVLRTKLLGCPVQARTFHAYGFHGIRDTYGHFSLDDKGALNLRDDFGVASKDVYTTSRAVSLAKNMLLEGHDEILDACDNAGIEYEDGDALAETVQEVLERDKDFRDVMSNDDMIWFPTQGRTKTQLPLFSQLFVDEMQDTCKAQFAMLAKMASDSPRLFAVADPAQAIFSFRGADKRAVTTFRETYKPIQLPLSVSFRCAKSIIREAQRFAYDIQALPDAPEGKVRDAKLGDALNEVEYGDYILSRTNAPLLRCALRLLQTDCRVAIAGQDGLGDSLYNILKKFAAKSDSPRVVEQDVTRWLLKKRNALDESQREAQLAYDDKIACFRTLLGDSNNMNEVLEKTRALFRTGSVRECVTLSTTHKAKGMERNRVFLLRDTYKCFNEEERNLLYVGITRARHELVYVYGEE